MKKIILLPLLVLMTFINYSQNQELLDNSWFAHSARDSSVSNMIFEDIQSTAHELRFEVIFQADKIIVEGCCGGVFEVEVNYIDEIQLEILNLNETEIIDCQNDFVGSLYQIFKGVFNGLTGETITYSITSYTNIFGQEISSFVLSNPNNNSFIEISNIPNETTEDSHAAYTVLPPGDHWSLVKVSYDGELLQLPYGAAMANFDIYEGTFEIELCGIITGQMNFSWMSDVDMQGPCFISCDVLNSTSSDCEAIEDYETPYLESFKQNTFNFLMDNIHNEMYWEFDFGNSYKLTITEFSSGGQLIFYSNDSYLNTADYNLSELKIYPNPVSEILYLESENHEIAKMSLYDITGKLLQTLDTSIQEIDARNLNNGLYFLVLESASGETVVRKFLKR